MNMLRKESKLVVASLLAAALGALSSFGGGQPEPKRETRTVEVFTEVSLGGSAHVLLKQGSPQSVVVEASPEALAEFETVVQNKQLRLGYRHDKTNWGSYKDRGPVTVYITAPDLTALRVAGSGTFEVDGPLKTAGLTLAMTGSGNLKVPQLAATKVETVVAGSGNVVVSGTCTRHEAQLSGSGNVKAHDLQAETCLVRVSGSGTAHMHASQTAEANIAGSGNVLMAGGAQTTSSIHGSGHVVKE